MRALGFCVSIEHARFMAKRLTDAPAYLPSASVGTAETESDVRRQAIASL